MSLSPLLLHESRLENGEVISIQKKRELQKRALAIVERLLDNPVTEDYLLSIALNIRRNDYKDVLEERAIVKQCGYPVCPNVLRKVTKQKYHISTAENKVYDISERKNFCSAYCLKASKYFELQLMTCPLWIEEKNLSQIHLIPKNGNNTTEKIEQTP